MLVILCSSIYFVDTSASVHTHTGSSSAASFSAGRARETNIGENLVLIVLLTSTLGVKSILSRAVSDLSVYWNFGVGVDAQWKQLRRESCSKIVS